MLTNQQKAQAVVSALEEASPQLLVKLVEDGQLALLLKDRLDKFNLEYVRRMQGQPESEEAEIVESLMPMLTEFPPSPDQRPLSSHQQTQVSKQVQTFVESLPKPIPHPSLSSETP